MKSEKAKRIYKTIMLIVVCVLVTAILTGVYVYNKVGKGTSKYTILNNSNVDSALLKKIYTIKSIIDNKYINKEIDEDELIEAAVKGYVEGLDDEYTEYFDADEMKSFLTETQGSYVGIGIYMFKNTKDNTIVVLYPIENSPAEKAGIKTGDIITKVDGIEYNGDDFDNIASYIKGKAGTKVNIEIKRNEETLNFEIQREDIDLYPMKSEVLENNIGYINIQAFDNGCSKEFKEKYDELNKNNNLNGLIIDLRNNGGGIVDEALDIADYILDEDQTMLITVNRNGDEDIEKAKEDSSIDLPIVILTNEYTASASEILAAALRENNKATIVGEKTYGKGVIQELISLSDGSGIKITTEEYYTPNRNKINKVGITPDIEVELPEDILTSYKLEKSKDTQLQEAIETMSVNER